MSDFGPKNAHIGTKLFKKNFFGQNVKEINFHTFAGNISNSKDYSQKYFNSVKSRCQHAAPSVSNICL